jgi:hypothetical protein
VPLKAVRPGAHTVSVASSPFVVYDDYLGNGDCRPLVFQLKALRVEAEGAESRRAAA